MKGLQVFDLSHAYGDNRVLNNIDLTIPVGELICLLGPSGCGKSTLLRLAAGLEKVQTGTIIIDDVTVANPESHVNPEQRHIGLMFQDYALFPHLSIIDNVTFGLGGMDADKAPARAMDMLEQVRMTEYTESYPHMLSGGQQQRVALARALAPKPKILFLDEPFSGLDTNMRQTIREETLNVLKHSGVATLMVTHDPEEAMFMADRIHIIGSNGRILQAGSPHEIYYHPNHEFVTRLFGVMNQFDGVVSKGRVETPLGPVATELAEGSQVQVLVRPEGVILEINNKSGGVQVEIISNHLLGHDIIARVRVGGIDGKELYVRVSHTFEVETKKSVSAILDHEYAFVFPLDKGGEMASLATADPISSEAQTAVAEATWKMSLRSRRPRLGK